MAALKEVIKSQYLASLAMLKEAIVNCPESLWYEPETKNKFWHVAYHTLFYTHLYVQESESTFTPWPNHRENYEFMGPLPWPLHETPQIGEPFSQAEVLDYLEFCENEVENRLNALDFENQSSGFPWLPFGKLELQFYTIRHLQQHIGELSERLGTEGIEIGWIGMKP